MSARPIRAGLAGAVLARLCVIVALVALTGTAHGQITFVASSNNGVTNGPDLLLTVPAGAAVGDLLIGIMTVRDRPPGNLTSPGGWTRVFEPPLRTPSSGNVDLLIVFDWKIATAADVIPGTSFTWSWGGNRDAAGVMFAFRGVDTAAPIESASSVELETSGTTITIPGVTVGGPGRMLVGGAAILANTGFTWSAPMTLGAQRGQNSLAVTGAYEATAVASGPTGSRVVTPGASSNRRLGVLVALRPGGNLSHYAIDFPNGATGITCEPSQVRVTAHDASHNPVNVPAGTTLSLTTSTGTGVWLAPLVAGTGTWTPSDLNNGQATYAWPGGQSSFTANLRHATPVTLNVNVTDGTRSEAASEDPSLTFADSLFRFVEGAPTLGNPILAQISGKPSNIGYNTQSLVLQAIRTDLSGACTGVFTGLVSVQLASECVNPGACQAGQQVAFTNNAVTTALPQNAAGSVGPNAGTYATASVLFGANSQAAFSFSYPDAGNIRLHARVRFTPPVAGLTSTYGASGNITVRPFGFRISGVPSGVTGPTSAVFRRAGQNFDVTLTAVAWKSGDDADADGAPDSQAQIAGNSATPNFGLESTPATASVSHTLAEPAGGAAGALSNTLFTGFSAGARTQTMTYSEVGIINLFATTANYLASGQSVTAGAAGLAGVGRFIPSHFALSAATLTNRSASACAPASTFTYMNEPLRLQYTLTAQNTANATTTNYRGSFARLDLTAPASFGFGARDIASSTNLTPRIDTALGTTGAWGSGVASNIQATLSLTRASPDNPDGPFNQVKLGIAPSDPDTVTIAPGALDFSTTGGPNDRAQVGADTQIRFGRLRLTSAFGSEIAALTVPMQVEYWNGIGFLPNTLDSCTTLARSAFTLSNFQGNLAACETAFNADPIAFTSGAASPQLAAPGSGNDGSVDLRVNLGTASGNACNAVGGPGPPATSAARSYLKGRWNATDDDANPATNYDDDPVARAAFGVYGPDRSSNRFIYRRENY